MPSESDSDGFSAWSVGRYPSSDWLRPTDVLSLDAPDRVSLIPY